MPDRAARRRDDLDWRHRAVSDALDELNHRMHGLSSSWAYPEEFLEFLAEQGYTVVPDEAFQRLVNVAEYVSMGRSYVGVKPYPDATARFALGALSETGEADAS